MLDYASMVQAEEIARADESAKIARIIAGGGRLTLHCDRVNGKTYLTQAARDAQGVQARPTELKGELWGVE